MEFDDSTGDEQFDKAFLQEFNQSLSRAGARAIMPEDWAAASPAATAIGQLDGVEFPLNNNWIARRMAADIVRAHMLQWDATGERAVDTRYCRQYEPPRGVRRLPGLRTQPAAGLWL